MRKTLKKYFIPHHTNDHTPHILRDASITFFLGIVLITEVTFLSQSLLILPHVDSLGNVISTVVVAETNQNRIADNLSSLRENQLLVEAASAKANDMATKGYFAHNTPDGKEPWYWLQQAGYKYEYAGENLAINFYDSKDVVNAWMNSPEHRANILNQHYTEIGIATAEGMYEGKQALFTVQFFGRAPATPQRQIVKNSEATLPGQTIPTRKIKTDTSIAVASNPTPTLTSPLPEQSLQTSVQGAEIHVVSDMNTVASAEANTALQTPTISKVSLSQNLIANPRHVANSLYLTIFSLISVALLLTFFLKIKIQHPRIITTGVLFLSVIATFAVLNTEIINVFGAIK